MNYKFLIAFVAASTFLSIQPLDVKTSTLTKQDTQHMSIARMASATKNYVIQHPKAIVKGYISIVAALVTLGCVHAWAMEAMSDDAA